MDVFSLLKFWRNAASACDPTVTGDFDSSSLATDDEESFFDLVFTNDFPDSPNVFTGFQVVNAGDSSPGGDVYSNNRRKVTPKSPLRTFMLGFQSNKQSKSEKQETNCEIFNDEVKIGSLLKRDNSLRQKLKTEKLLLDNNEQTPSKRFSKDVVNKYLNLMKPSKRNLNEKSSSSEKSVTPSSSPASSVFSPRKEEKRGGGVFREVRKHLGKSQSASAILQTPVMMMKSDDSALEQQDGIQSAILHCKRSYNSPSQEWCLLSRSESAPSNNQPRISIEEENRSSI